MKKIYVLSLTVCMTFTASASVITFNPATGGTAANNNQTVGWQFNVLSPLNATGLEWYDASGTGLNTAHTVGIWNPAGTLLTSILIPAGVAAPLDGMFRIEVIAPINLPVGNGYIVGGQNFAASTDLMACGSGGPCDGPLVQTVDPRLSFVNATFSNPGGFIEPTSFSIAHEGFFGPSFSAAPIPEPSSMLLLGIGLIVVASAMRYRRQRTT
jgi:PEP-CTERM motif